MLSFKEINELIKTIDASTVQELELEGDGLRLVICKSNKAAAGNVMHTGQPAAAAAFAQDQQVQHIQPIASAAGHEPSGAQLAAAASAEPAAVEDTSQLHQIVSPMVGTFYRAPSPDKPPFVNAGVKVGDRSVVCIIEAMKLMNEIEAECSGEIVRILAENGQLVEYGQPLFLVKKK